MDESGLEYLNKIKQWADEIRQKNPKAAATIYGHLTTAYTRAAQAAQPSQIDILNYKAKMDEENLRRQEEERATILKSITPEPTYQRSYFGLNEPNPIPPELMPSQRYVPPQVQPQEIPPVILPEARKSYLQANPDLYPQAPVQAPTQALDTQYYINRPGEVPYATNMPMNIKPEDEQYIKKISVSKETPAPQIGTEKQARNLLNTLYTKGGLSPEAYARFSMPKEQKEEPSTIREARILYPDLPITEAVKQTRELIKDTGMKSSDYKEMDNYLLSRFEGIKKPSELTENQQKIKSQIMGWSLEDIKSGNRNYIDAIEKSILKWHEKNKPSQTTTPEKETWEENGVTYRINPKTGKKQKWVK